MPREWVITVGLGSLAMAGVALVFFVVWAVDRKRTYALSFAGAIICYSAGTVALSLPIAVSLACTIQGVFFPLSILMLADGLLRRVGDRLSRSWALGFVVVMTGLVWYFSYLYPLLVARIITQNLGAALFVLVLVRRLWTRVPRTGPDRAAVIVTGALAAALTVDVAAALFSTVPREITTKAQLDNYLTSDLELALLVSSTVVLPMFMVTMLAATLIDMVRDLRFERDCDDLTGVLNRRGFNHRAHRLVQSADSCALIMADLDFFKRVNDTLGHAAGDRVLTAFAQILKESPKNARIVGRIGGEEFAVLLPGCGHEAAVEWAEAVRTRMAAESISVGGTTITVTASFGIAVGDARTQLTLLSDAADRALYKAKVGGRNQTVMSREVQLPT